MFFIHFIILWSLFNSFKKFEIEMDSLGKILIIVLYCIKFVNIYDLYTLNSFSGWKGL